MYIWICARAAARTTHVPGRRPATRPGSTKREAPRAGWRAGLRGRRGRKPSSVPRGGRPPRGDDHSSRTDVSVRLVSGQPGGVGRASLRPPLARRPAPLRGLAPGGVCRAASVAGRAVGSYPAVSPLPDRPASRRSGRSVLCGTFLEVTLTGRYPAPCPAELGLSSRGSAFASPPATV